MTTIGMIISLSVYTFLVARYFYVVGWNTAMEEVQKSVKNAPTTKSEEK